MICVGRSMELVYQRPGVVEGIPVYRFVAPTTLFANGSVYPPNEGFCPCRQSGLLNVSTCRNSESLRSMPTDASLSPPHKHARTGPAHRPKVLYRDTALIDWQTDRLDHSHCHSTHFLFLTFSLTFCLTHSY